MNESIKELIKRIELLEADVKRLKSKQPFRSLGKGKNLEKPSTQKVVIAQ